MIPINERELSIGDIVRVKIDDIQYEQTFQEKIVLTGEVTEIRKDLIGIIVKEIKTIVPYETKLKIGDEILVPKRRAFGLYIDKDSLICLDFIDSDERAWKLLYYFGDMRLYYKFDNKNMCACFKFKPDFTQKTWVRISCLYVHQLQNIMRFLTGGELEFNFKKIKI